MGQYVHIKPYKANKHYIRLVHAVKASHEPHAHAVTCYISTGAKSKLHMQSKCPTQKVCTLQGVGT